MKRILVSIITLALGATVHADQTSSLSQYQPYIEQGLDYARKHLGDWIANIGSPSDATKSPEANVSSAGVTQPDEKGQTHKMKQAHSRISGQESKLNNLIMQRDALKRQEINLQEEINKERATIAAEHKREGLAHHKR